MCKNDICTGYESKPYDHWETPLCEKAQLSLLSKVWSFPPSKDALLQLKWLPLEDNPLNLEEDSLGLKRASDFTSQTGKIFIYYYYLLFTGVDLSAASTSVFLCQGSISTKWMLSKLATRHWLFVQEVQYKPNLVTEWNHVHSPRCWCGHPDIDIAA